MLVEPTHLRLADLTPFHYETAGRRLSSQIADYLGTLFADYHLPQGKRVYLPSILEMGRFFRTNHLAVHDAFQLLRGQGFDYMLTGIEEPILFWKTEPR